MRSLVEQIEARHAEAEAQLSDPAVIGDRLRYAEAGRLYNQLAPAARLAEAWRRAQDDAAGAEELLAEDGEEPELRAMLEDARARSAELEEEIRLAMVERDPSDDKNVIVEIRGGAGGDEAGLWAGDLYRMLTRYADRRGFKTETMSATDGAYTFEVRGDGAYSVFKFEGGTHRVQRVPETESQGRIHTSTATVAVLPEAEDVDVQLEQSDLEIDVYRSSGPGGQSVNTTDSAVRITHKPTGIVVSMQDEKSQLQNRERAMKVLRARLYEAKLAAQQAEQAAARSAQVGTGERAEKIRTYNFPERRVTDHRIKHTAHNLDQLLAGRARRVHRGAAGRREAPPARRRGTLTSFHPARTGARELHASEAVGGCRGVSLLLGGGLACSANDPPGGENRYSIATGGSGGVYQVYGGGLADLMTDELPDAPTTAETTSASVDNLILVAEHDSDIGFTLSDTAIDAVQGDASFDAPLDLRALATIYPNITQVAVKADSGIERIEDLEGKTVSVGSPNSGTEVIALRLLEVAGLDPDEDIDKRGLGVGESVQALRDGSIDGFFWSGGVRPARSPT